jgi:BirA family biotin operon repressor/biotin-[acetyl-CoA-carboxylase] ligase
MLPHSLKSLPLVERFYSYPEIGSTNDAARGMIEFPRQGIFVIQADRQTAGRGRRGTPWFSESKHGLWATILTPLSAPGAHFSHNRALSCALCDAVESSTQKHIRCTIKWPNDIYIKDKKACGILLESHPLRPDMLVLGFGLNVNTTRDEFPQELRSIATSVSIETGERFSLSRLLEAIVSQYLRAVTIDPDVLHRSYTSRLQGLGRRMEIEGKTGTFDGVEIDGRLRLAVGHEVIYMVSGHCSFI